MDEDDHHGMHVVEFVVAYSGAVLDQGPPLQQILARLYYYRTCVLAQFELLHMTHISCPLPLLVDAHEVIVLLPKLNISGCSAHRPEVMGSPIICCSKSDKSEEECVRSKSIINGKHTMMNHKGKQPPRRSNSSVQVELWAPSSRLATKTYEATIGSLGGPTNMSMRLRATNRFYRIQHVPKAGWVVDAEYRGPVGSVLFNNSEADFMFTVVSMHDASVKMVMSSVKMVL
ncbi:hypothetical protein VPH35_009147 [Triticum aestivum]